MNVGRQKLFVQENQEGGEINKNPSQPLGTLWLSISMRKPKEKKKSP